MNRQSRKPSCSLPALALLPLLLSSPAVAQDFYYGGRVPLLIKRPITNIMLMHELNKGSIIGQHRSGDAKTQANRATLSLSTSGFVYHPALLTWGATINQAVYSSSHETAAFDQALDNSGKFFGYDINTTWLKEKPYSLTWSTSRDQTRTANNSLQPESLQESSRRQGELDLKFTAVPTQVIFGNSDFSLESYYPEQRSDNYWNVSSQHSGENHETHVLLRKNETMRQVAGRSNTLQNQNVNFRHSRRLQKSGNLNLGFNARQEDWSGNERRSASASSGLSLKHPGNFSSNWSAAASEYSYANVNARNRTLGGRISHQLYDNLTTSLGTGRSTNQDNTGDGIRDSRSLNVTYRRRIPWGQFQVSRGKSRDTVDDNRTAAYNDIVDEAYTFAGISTTVLLLNPNIDIHSISVLSSDGLTLFEPGIDYTIEQIGNTVVINRNNLAGIGDDETVLVSYRYTALLPSVRRFEADTFSAQLAIGRLTMGLSNRKTATSLLEGVSSQDLPWSDMRSLSLTYNKGNSSTSVRVDRTRNEFSDYESRALIENLRFTPGPRSSLNVNLQAREMEFMDTGQRRREIGINADFSKRLGASSTLGVSGFVISAAGDGMDRDYWGLRLHYNWRYGAWHPALQFSYNENDDRFSAYQSTDYMLRLEARRIFR